MWFDMPWLSYYVTVKYNTETDSSQLYANRDLVLLHSETVSKESCYKTKALAKGAKHYLSTLKAIPNMEFISLAVFVIAWNHSYVG